MDDYLDDIDWDVDDWHDAWDQVVDYVEENDIDWEDGWDWVEDYYDDYDDYFAWFDKDS
jgi:hypothetical protein